MKTTNETLSAKQKKMGFSMCWSCVLRCTLMLNMPCPCVCMWVGGHGCGYDLYWLLLFAVSVCCLLMFAVCVCCLLSLSLIGQTEKTATKRKFDQKPKPMIKSRFMFKNCKRYRATVCSIPSTLVILPWTAFFLFEELVEESWQISVFDHFFNAPERCNHQFPCQQQYFDLFLSFFSSLLTKLLGTREVFNATSRCRCK